MVTPPNPSPRAPCRNALASLSDKPSSGLLDGPNPGKPSSTCPVTRSGAPRTASRFWRAITRDSVARSTLAIVRTVWVLGDAELFCVTRSPQRAMLAGPSATPTAGSVQNQPRSRALLLVPFVPTLPEPHSQAHTSDTTNTHLV